MVRVRLEEEGSEEEEEDFLTRWEACAGGGNAVDMEIGVGGAVTPSMLEILA